jgi:hypothetical protein
MGLETRLDSWIWEWLDPCTASTMAHMRRCGADLLAPLKLHSTDHSTGRITHAPSTSHWPETLLPLPRHHSVMDSMYTNSARGSQSSASASSKNKSCSSGGHSSSNSGSAAAAFLKRRSISASASSPVSEERRSTAMVAGGNSKRADNSGIWREMGACGKNDVAGRYVAGGYASVALTLRAAAGATDTGPTTCLAVRFGRNVRNVRLALGCCPWSHLRCAFQPQVKSLYRM